MPTLMQNMWDVWFLFYSFHVGSGAQSASAYANALASAKEVFLVAVSLFSSQLTMVHSFTRNNLAIH